MYSAVFRFYRWHFNALRYGTERWAFHPGHVSVPAILRTRTVFTVADLEDERIIA